MRLDRVKVITELAKRDLKKKDLAERSGFARVTVSRICNGNGCNTNTAKAIAEALGVTVEDLV